MRSEILSAIQDEISQSSQRLEFKVAEYRREGSFWVVVVDLSVDDAKGLDESYEGSIAWWPAKPTNGAADVLSVIPEKQQINLRFATRQPPEAGASIFLYPPRYLEALKEVWTDLRNANRSSEWLTEVRSRKSCQRDRVPHLGSFSSILRPNQCDAFKLLGWNIGFLWGPPGTGKTFTLGAMLSRYMCSFPSARVLLLSTTNSATDQMLVSVDRALERLSQTESLAGVMRQLCKRVGHHFIASNYTGRDHLLPMTDPRLLQQLTELESQRPDRQNVQSFGEWKASGEAIRREIRRQAGQVLDTARLAAMTTTRAAFTFDQLAERMPFDLFVFDEASQVSLAHAMAIAPLAKAVVFAGDPNQLAPIVQSKQRHAQRWLGRSMFAEIEEDHESTCFLTEQSRMAQDICTIVSNCFYSGKLVVAGDALSSANWRAERRLSNIRTIRDDAVHLDLK